MLKRNKILAAMAVAAPFALAAPAQGAFIIETNWTLDPSAVVAGLPDADTIGPIDQITFNAIVSSISRGGAVLAEGDIVDVVVLGHATSFINDGSSTGGTGLNDTWELTFRFDGTVQITDISGNDIDFDHLAGGVVNFFIDDLTDGAGEKANQNSAGSYTDGTQFASFIDDGTGGGNIDTDDLDGNDDFSADIDVDNTMAGVIFDEDGNDMGTNPGTQLVVDSNFDLDPMNTGGFSADFGAFDCGASFASFCAEEDGSARLATEEVPEPAVLGLLGLGLLGLAANTYRRRTRA